MKGLISSALMLVVGLSKVQTKELNYGFSDLSMLTNAFRECGVFFVSSMNRLVAFFILLQKASMEIESKIGEISISSVLESSYVVFHCFITLLDDGE